MDESIFSDELKNELTNPDPEENSANQEKEVGQENEQETPAEETNEQEQKPEEKPEEKPDWFYADKFKSVEDQAKAYADAVREMKRAQEERAQLRKEIESLKKSENVSDVADFSEDIKEKLEEKYGMPFNQIQAFWDVQNLVLEQKLKPIEETILSSQFENTLSRFENENPLFKDYKDKVIEKLSSVPLAERIKPTTVKRAWAEVVAENFNDIIERVRAEARSKGTPASPPSVSGNTKKVESKPKKSVLTEEEKNYLLRVGANIDDIEKFASGEIEKKRENLDKLIEL